MTIDEVKAWLREQPLYWEAVAREWEAEKARRVLRDEDGEVITPERWIRHADECPCGTCEPSPSDLEIRRRMNG